MKCEFANNLSVKNKVQETLYTDVRDMDEAWAKQFVDEASRKECQVILVMAGFPCKGLSRNRIDNLQNKGFIHQESKLVSEIPGILLTLRRIARAKNIEVHHIIESAKMPQEEQDIVCNVLNGIPTMEERQMSYTSKKSQLQH